MKMEPPGEWLFLANGLYWNYINLAGDIDKTECSYNQGTMIGVNALLSNHRLLCLSLWLMPLPMPCSPTTAVAGRLYKQDPPFNVIFFKNLLLLDSVDHNPRFLAGDAGLRPTRRWTSLRDPVMGLFEFDGSQPVKLLFQSAMVQIYDARLDGEGLPADGVSRRRPRAHTLCRLRYSRSEVAIRPAPMQM